MYIVAVCLLISSMLYYSYRYAWWKKPIDYSYPRILMYHMIKEHTNGKFKGLRVSPSMFEKQVKYLSDNGWYFATMNELLMCKNLLPEKSVAITFDDGYEDNYIHAFSILKRYNAKATIYLVVDRHNREWSSKRKEANSGGELMREPKLTDVQIMEMVQSGLVEIGSHTMTHDNFKKIGSDKKVKEIRKSKEIIESDFGTECNSFCYPFGLFDDDDWRLVQKAGYISGVTTQKGIDNIMQANPYLLKRITISGKDNFIAFLLKIRHGKRGIKK